MLTSLFPDPARSAAAGGMMRASGLTKHLLTQENPLQVQRSPRPASKNVWGFETLEKIA